MQQSILLSTNKRERERERERVGREKEGREGGEERIVCVCEIMMNNTNQMKGQSLVSFSPIVSFQLPVMSKQLSSTTTQLYGQFVKTQVLIKNCLDSLV